MARTLNVFRTYCVILICFSVFHINNKVNAQWIFSLNIEKKTCDNICVYDIIVRGNLNNTSWDITREPANRGHLCQSVIHSNYKLNILHELNYKLEVLLPYDDEKLYVCLKSNGVWVHQGVNIFLEPKNDVNGAFRFDNQYVFNCYTYVPILIVLWFNFRVESFFKLHITSKYYRFTIIMQ